MPARREVHALNGKENQNAQEPYCRTTAHHQPLGVLGGRGSPSHDIGFRRQATADGMKKHREDVDRKKDHVWQQYVKLRDAIEKGQPVPLWGESTNRSARIAPDEPMGISIEKADLMGRIEWAMLHGGVDVTAMKNVEGFPQSATSIAPRCGTRMPRSCTRSSRSMQRASSCRSGMRMKSHSDSRSMVRAV